jgi:hypothetical protein
MASPFLPLPECSLCGAVCTAACYRCAAPACRRCDRCHGCGNVICERCERGAGGTAPFRYDGDAVPHPHVEGALALAEFRRRGHEPPCERKAGAQ